jgi:hypothetical protein
MHLVGMPEAGLYRAGRWSDVGTFPPPAPRINLAVRQVDGYRWDDALGGFATAKCSASAEAAIGRTIARYRRRTIEPGVGLIDAIKGFLMQEPDPGEPELLDNRVPEDIFDDLYLIHLPGDRRVVFVDLEHEHTLETLSEQLGPTVNALGLGVAPLAGNLAREEDRRVTRLVTRALHSLCSDGRYGPVAGIRYPGQPDPEWEAFVLWRPPDLVDLDSDDVELRWVAHWDADTLAAAKRLGLDWPPT